MVEGSFSERGETFRNTNRFARFVLILSEVFWYQWFTCVQLGKGLGKHESISDYVKGLDNMRACPVKIFY